jgi:hypothetical protein
MEAENYPLLSILIPTHRINRSEFKSHYIASLVLSMMTMTSAAAGFNLTCKKEHIPNMVQTCFCSHLQVTSIRMYDIVWVLYLDVGERGGWCQHVQNCVFF